MANEPKINLALVGEMPENPVRGTVYMSPDASGNFVKVGVDGSVRTIFDGSDYVRKDESVWIPGESENSAVLANGFSYAIGDNSVSHGFMTYARGLTSHAEGAGLADYPISVYSDFSNNIIYSTKTISFSFPESYIGFPVIYHDVYATIVNAYLEKKRGIVFVLDKPLLDDGSDFIESTEVYLLSGGVAAGEHSHTEGDSTVAIGDSAHAEGFGTYAGSWDSHAEGVDTITYGQGAHAEGSGTLATGNGSHVEGNNARTLGDYSHAEGSFTTASGDYSHAEGEGQEFSITINGSAGVTHYEVTGGLLRGVKVGDTIRYQPIQKIKYVSLPYEKTNPEDSYRYSVITEVHLGKSWYIEVVNTLDPSNAITNSTAYILQGVAEGIGSHSEGKDTNAVGNYSHVEGNSTTALGDNSHAEGSITMASGYSSHAEGYMTTASGNYSHAEGSRATTFGDYSHAEGEYAVASGECSHAEGLNMATTISISGAANSTTYVSQHSNRLNVGNEIWTDAASNVKARVLEKIDGRTFVLDKTLNADTALDNEPAMFSAGNACGRGSHKEGAGGIALGTGSHVEGLNAIAAGANSHAEGKGTLSSNDYSHAEGNCAISSNDYSHAEGNYTIAYGQASHSEGTNAFYMSPYTISGNANTTTYTTSIPHSLRINQFIKIEGASNICAKIIAVTSDTFTLDKTLDASGVIDEETILVYYGAALGDYSHVEGHSTIASGDYSHAEGYYTTASNEYSHAEGRNTVASGNGSHAEGYMTTASGAYSHTEGNRTTASGYGSRAEGDYTIAFGQYSHAEGTGTQTTNNCEHAQGKYNISRSDTLFSIGTGDNDNNRKNIIEVNNNSLYIEQVGNFDGSTLDVSTKTVAQVFNFKPLQDVYYDYIFNGGDMPTPTKRVKVIYFDDYPDGIDYYADEWGFEDSSSYIAACIEEPFTYGVNVCWYMNDVEIDGVTHELYGITKDEDNFNNRIPDAYGVLKTDSIDYMTANSLETNLSNEYCPFVSIDFGDNEYPDESNHFTLLGIREIEIPDE